MSYERWLEYLGRTRLPARGGRAGLASRSDGPAGQKSDRLLRAAPKPRDVLVQCPKCKTFETLQFVEGALSPCRKFSQKDGKIYHDCGSDLPCRLHSLTSPRGQ
jgi:hypothetical protein